MSSDKIVVETMVSGGKATAGPPLGPALGPTGVNLGQVVSKINELTKKFSGLKVPIKVTVDKKTRGFEIEVGTPPAAALILVELKKDKGSQTPNTQFIGNLTIDQVISIAEAKRGSMFVRSLKSAVMSIAGTALSMGVTIEGKKAKEFQEEVRAGKWDSHFKK